jgi:hypothetical protein
MTRQPDCRLELLEMLIVDYSRAAKHSEKVSDEAAESGLEVGAYEGHLTAQAYMWVSAELQVIRQRLIEEQRVEPSCEDCVHYVHPCAGAEGCAELGNPCRYEPRKP